MKNKLLQTILPHAAAVVIFFVITLAYFTPLLEGKGLYQHDIMQHKGMSKEIVDYRAKTGKEALWTNSMFGGMPAYLISVEYGSNLMKYVYHVLRAGLGNPAKYLFISLICFYILMLVVGMNPWLSIAGAIAYAFSSYFFIVEAAGHNSKALAMAYMPGIIAGVILAYRKKIIFGAVLLGIFLALQLLADHIQITYYTFLIILFLALVEFIFSIREKTISHFAKASAALAIAAVLAVGTNFANIWSVYEYGKESMRGKSELTAKTADKTSGLDRSYIFGWSYGVTETATILIPNIFGGASTTNLGTSSATYKWLKDNGVEQAKQISKNASTYWGDQPSTSGPVYFGAIVMFLFMLGLFLVERKYLWWLVPASFLGIMLSWGSNFGAFNNFMVDYFPMYNKFRSVSMALVIPGLTIPIVAFLVLKRIVNEEIKKEQFIKAFKYSLGIVGGFTVMVLLISGGLDYVSSVDKMYLDNKWPQELIDALRSDRKSMLRMDAIRSLVFILLSAAALYGFVLKKVSRNAFFAALAVLILIDMWTVNKRYLNNDNFITKRDVEVPFQPSAADELIMKDKTPNIRVINLGVSTFNDASTSYFHHSIGGYHGAKLKRYQELIENSISKEINKLYTGLQTGKFVTSDLAVLNMLNTRYFILQDNQGNPTVQINTLACGNAWFVNELKIVKNADEELASVENFDPEKTAIVDKRFENQLAGFQPQKDSTATINLEKSEPNYLVYKTKSNTEGVAVFSEIYYKYGWNASIDGKPVEHFRADYILRAMKIPAGEHKVEFKFEPKSYSVGVKVNFASSLMLILIFLGVVGVELKNMLKGKEEIVEIKAKKQ